ncbi:TetR/AcrR family transcriptional regulator [Nocardia inohanensis]|uniref:TetR/AcrR family transcriptional regulator n=1 Tax=Nocardia inohanensis TaxID=209246 RepID=UPI00082BF808
MAMQTRGRPRSFDREAALDKALRLFWERGYEATSVSDLTKALGIGTPSLYAAFGDKQKLFNEALETYGERYGGFAARAFEEEPTARAAAARTLREAAIIYTTPDQPPGCMVIHAGINTTNTEVRDLLTGLRNGNVEAFERRIRADIAAGRLPADTDARALARFTGAMLNGMSQASRDGADRSELERMAALAMLSWPNAQEAKEG